VAAHDADARRELLRAALRACEAALERLPGSALLAARREALTQMLCEPQVRELSWMQTRLQEIEDEMAQSGVTPARAQNLIREREQLLRDIAKAERWATHEF
jgi:hypothetical protein